jgi:AcrR family transcriptional regulator
MEYDVPRALRALWRPDHEVRRGPKPARSIQEIAEAAIGVADREGLGAVTMAAVAAELGFTTMALYRYVDSRELLLQVMVDVAVGPPPDPNPRLGWRRQVEVWARAEAARLGQHPWALDVRPDTPPLGPHTLGWMDTGLRSLASSGLTEGAAASALLIVDGYVRSQVLLTQQYADPAKTRDWAGRLRTVIDPERLPAVAAALAAGVFDDSPEESEFPGDEFDFGLAVVLDGLEALARKTRRES